MLRWELAVGTPEPGKDFGEFNKPSFVILLPNGCFCIADSRNHRLQIIPRAHLDGNGGERVFMWPVPGHGDCPGDEVGCFRCPTGLGLHGKVLFVSDYENGRVQRLHTTALSGGGDIPAPEAKMLLKGFQDQLMVEEEEEGPPPWENWPLLPLNDLKFNSPQGMAIVDSMLYLADDGGPGAGSGEGFSRVYAIDLADSCRRRYVIRASGSRVAGPALRPAAEDPRTFPAHPEDALKCVRGVTAHAGELFVADGHADTVHVYSCESGAWLRDVGSGLRQPYGLCVAHGMLYVTEFAGAAVSVFAVATGACVQREPLGCSANLDWPPQPWGIAMDATQEAVCVVDHRHHMLHVFRVG